MSTLVLAIVLPLLAAFLLPVAARVASPLATALGPLTLLAVVAVVVRAAAGLGDHPVSIEIGGFPPPLGINLYVDGLALLFALAVPVATLLLWPWGTDEQVRRRQSLTLLLAGSTGGLAVSGDLFNLYVFYELSAVATYGLVADRGTAAGYAAAFRYLVVSSLGSVIALVGIALVYLTTGTLNLAHLATLQGELAGPAGLAAFLCLLVGYGVKAELFPVNAWVPEVYAASSRRLAGLLAGLVSKLAVLVVLRLLVLVFPQPQAHEVLLLLGTLGVLTGELAAWRSRDLARMLAWSSIGQLGLVFIAFSISGPAGIAAGLAVALHHLLAKPALFLLAERWGGGLEALRGAGRASPLAGVLFILFSLSLVGVPPLPGFWAKFLLLSGLSAEGGGAQLLALGVVLVATVIEANYLMRVVGRLYERPTGESSLPAHGRLDLATSALLGAALVAATLAIVPVGSGLTRLAETTADTALYVETVARPEVPRP